MKCEVIAVGTELLLGQIVDTNSSWIGEHLALHGIDTHFQTKVGDNWDRIAEAIRLGLSRSDAIIMCGGLGPTQDDITRDVVAAVMGVELVHDDAIEDRIRSMFSARGRAMPENNLRQAKIPAGASPIAQQPGTAPGLVCPIGEQLIFCVPGVPWEMQQMVLGTVLPTLQERAGVQAVIESRVLRTWGQSESGLAEQLADRIDTLEEAGNPTLAFLASGVEGIKVRVTAKADTSDDVQTMLDAEESVLRGLLGDIVFGLDDENMEAVVTRTLAEQGLTVAVAETLTGGYVAGRLSVAPSADDAFRGGVVVSDPQVAHSSLGIDGSLVTEAAADALARSAAATLGADYGLAAAGIAAGDAVDGVEPGTVHLAVAGPAGVRTSTVRLPGDRERVRQYACISLLDLLRRDLQA